MHLIFECLITIRYSDYHITISSKTGKYYVLTCRGAGNVWKTVVENANQIEKLKNILVNRWSKNIKIQLSEDNKSLDIKFFHPLLDTEDIFCLSLMETSTPCQNKQRHDFSLICGDIKRFKKCVKDFIAYKNHQKQLSASATLTLSHFDNFSHYAAAHHPAQNHQTKQYQNENQDMSIVHSNLDMVFDFYQIDIVRQKLKPIPKVGQFVIPELIKISQNDQDVDIQYIPDTYTVFTIRSSDSDSCQTDPI